MQVARQPKSHYSEAEAAVELGISVEELRSMIRVHILKNEEDLGAGPLLSLQASDVLVLRLLARGELARAS